MPIVVRRTMPIVVRRPETVVEWRPEKERKRSDVPRT
jgi:hypothetical protein